MNWLPAILRDLGHPEDAYYCPECERVEGRRHHADCSRYPEMVVRP